MRQSNIGLVRTGTAIAVALALSACGGGSTGSVQGDETINLAAKGLLSPPGNSGTSSRPPGAGPSTSQPSTSTNTSGSSPTSTPTSATTSTSTTSSDTSTTLRPPLPTTTSPTTTSGPTVAGAITSVSVVNIGAVVGSPAPLTFGQVFRQGDLKVTDTLEGTLTDGSKIPLQVNVKATHADGTVRHAIISTVVPVSLQGQAQVIGLTKGSSAATAPPTMAPALPNGLAPSASVTLDGRTYTATAADLIQAGKYQTWLSGPVVNEWSVSAPLKDSTGAVHPHLRARFAIRSYTGRNQARVEVTMENNWSYVAAPQNFTYDVAISVGGNTVFSKAGLTHYHHARWRKVFWWGGEPAIHVKHDTSYLIASKAVPNYDQSVVISPTALTSLRTSFSGAVTQPMATGLSMPYMPTTGGRPDIGLLPGWAVMYLLSMDKDAKAATLGTGDLAGSYSMHYRDEATDRPLSPVNHPYVTILGGAGDAVNPYTKQSEALPVCGGVCTTPNEADSAHEPSFGYLPYLVTGDQYYLDELQFWAMYNTIKFVPDYRGFDQGLIKADQVRGQAWSLRSMSEAAYITPDQDVLKPQFRNFVRNNLVWYTNTYVTGVQPDNNLGFITTQALVYNNETGIAPWQDDFFTSAVGRASELGFDEARPLLQWKAKFPVGRMTAPGYCWIHGSAYSLNVKAGVTGSIFATLSQAYQATVPAALLAMPCGGSQMATYLGLQVGEMVDSSDWNTGTASIMQPALAYSVDSVTTGAAQAWSLFQQRALKPDYSQGPQFAIVPR